MLKKIISASLSLTMLISAAAGDCFNGLIADNSSNKGHSSSDSRETQLKGQNSFGKYIERTSSKDKEEGIKPLSLKADSDSFKVSKIDFDLESGKLTVVTTQCSACTLKVEFIDDDDPNNVYELKTSVKAGERVETVLSVDKGQLPEFFKVRAVLTDTYGNELGDPFSQSKYMRFMQELDKATVNDYNEEYVVNLDADETTNFLVLNEDTIMAESTEEENTLVSADYDNDVYVFENINDSIRYLSAGDYFYAQPNDQEIIAVNVESIDIDGDTATIRGGGEVDDMFDVIKLEVDSDEIDTSALENDNIMDDVMINGVTEEDNDEYSIAYNGTAEDESGNQYLEYNVLKYSDTNTPQANGKLFDLVAGSILHDGKKIKIPFEWQIGSAKKDDNGNIERDEYGKKKLNTIGKDFIDYGKDANGIDKDHLFVDENLNSMDVECGFEITATIKLTFEANLTFYKYKKELEFGWDGSTELKLEAECSAKVEVSFDLCKIPIPTPIPGLGVELGCTFKFGIEASISISTGYKSPFAYHFIRYADGSTESRKDSDTDKDQKDQKNKFEVEGKFYIELAPTIGICLISSKLLSIDLEFPVKFEASVNVLTLESSFYDSNEGTPSFENLSDGNLSSGVYSVINPGNVSKYEPLHACPLCFTIEPSITAKIKLNIKVPFVKKMTFELAEKKWEWTNWHRSIFDQSIKKGDCNHYYYGTDLHIIGNDDISAAGLVVEVDGNRALTGSGDTVLFFLDPDRSHPYKIYSNGNEIKSGSISISKEYSCLDIKLDGGVKKADSVTVTTTTSSTQPPELHTVTSAIDTMIEENPDHVMIEYGKFGDNISYSLYPDGLLYIFGYGPMNYEGDPIQNKSLIKNVFIEDYATYIREELATELTNEVLITEFTERHCDELCEKYFEKYKDNILKDLNEKYNVENDDPDLDEIIDDYIYANKYDLAREYYDKNSDELQKDIVEFKKEFLAELDDKYVTSIGKQVFQGAANLETVYLSDKIEEISDNAFNGCKSLKSFRYGGEGDTTETLVFPAELKRIGAAAFLGCTEVPFGDIVFGDKLERIEMQAFQGDKGITSLYIPESATWIGNDSFKNCHGIKKAVIKASVDSIEGGIFHDVNYKTSEFEELVLPSFITVKDNTSLNQLFNDNEWGAYNDTDVPDSLKKLTVLNGDIIPEKAFSGFKSLTTIVIPSGITNIGNSAFEWLGNLENVYFIDKDDSMSFSEVFKDVEVFGVGAFFGCGKLQIGDLVFGDKTKSVGATSFQGVSGITSIYLPESVTWIGYDSFKNCHGIKKAVIKASIDSIEGGIFHDANYKTSEFEELVLPSFITVKDNTSLNQLFNDNEWGAYNDTDVPDSLKKLTVLNGDTIPEKAFSGFKSLTTIVIPSGITNIGNSAFEWLGNLENVYCIDKNDSMSFSEVFKDVEVFGVGAFFGCGKLQIGDLVFGDKTKSVGATSFQGVSGITSIYFPESVTWIGYDSFKNCHGIKKAVIKASIDSIERGIFHDANYKTSEFEELVIPSIITIENTLLLSQLFNDNEWGAYNDTDVPQSLKKIVILSGDTIPDNYLNGFRSVTVLGLPDELALVGTHATQSLSQLKEVIYSGTDEQWDTIVINPQNDPLLKAKRTKPEEVHIYGDANGDGEIDMSDAVMIMQALCNPNRYGINGTDPNHITEEGWKYADSDGNGLTLGDALRIQQYLLHLIPSLT